MDALGERRSGLWSGRAVVKAVGACCIAMVTALAIVGICYQRALADDVSAPQTSPAEAKLTKVIDIPLGVDASEDRYVFHFAGGGTAVEDSSGSIVCDGVVQSPTIGAGREIPVLDDLELRGVNATEENSVGSGTFKQSVTSASLAYILGLDNSSKPYADSPDRSEAHFQHSGIYTYEVTETRVDSRVSGVYVIKSRASYLLRVYVHNTDNRPAVSFVTVEKTAKDEGTLTDPSVKVDSTMPRADDAGRITEGGQPIETPAGDFRGRDAYGFTFANEYVLGGHFVVENKAEGSYADHERLFPTSIIIEDTAAPAGSCVTYQVVGGEDTTLDSAPIDGRVDIQEQCVQFQGNGAPLRIQADLRDGGRITITGLYGTVQGSAVDAAGNLRNKLSDGPNQGSLYAVSEVLEGNTPYHVHGFVYGTAGVRFDADGEVISNPIASIDGTTTGVSIGNPAKRALGGTGEYVLIVNSLDATDFSPTGVVMNNLPQVLFIGLPLVVLAVWLARRCLRPLRKSS